MGQYRRNADRAAERGIASAQQRALGKTETVNVDSAGETLRKRLLLDQDLQHGGPASEGVRELPDTDYWKAGKHLVAAETNSPAQAQETVLRLGLLEALQVSARNSREYSDAKESLFKAALAMDLEKDAFRATFASLLSAEYTQGEPAQNAQPAVDGGTADAATAADPPGSGTGEAGVTHKWANGVELTGRITLDLVKLVSQEAGSSLGVLADASVSIPLWRGAGPNIVGEPLKQSEQDLLYEVYAFERFKRVFAVSVAEEYLGVLEQAREVLNTEENYKGLVAAARRSRRLADAGRLPEFQFDQAVQNELRARTRWVEAQQRHQSRMDAFKVALGLPPDARIALLPDELDRLRGVAERLAGGKTPERAADVPPADEPVTLEPPGRGQPGAFELEPERADALALQNRLDLKTAESKVADAQRKVYVTADALRGEVTLLGKAQAGGIGAASAGGGAFSGLLTLDPPFERTAERNAYRNSLIDLEQSVRRYQELEDQIKLGVRDTLRTLLQEREGVLVQLQAVKLAEKRVRSTDMLLRAGRAQVRDLLESQEALLGAQNALTASIVSYRVAELGLQRDLGLLEVSADGLWNEYDPRESSK